MGLLFNDVLSMAFVIVIVIVFVFLIIFVIVFFLSDGPHGSDKISERWKVI